NVEFYAGVVMDACGIPREEFTPTFASSRVIGWCTHVLEQVSGNRLIRPAARYDGQPPPQPVPAGDSRPSCPRSRIPRTRGRWHGLGMRQRMTVIATAGTITPSGGHGLTMNRMSPMMPPPM